MAATSMATTGAMSQKTVDAGSVVESNVMRSVPAIARTPTRAGRIMQGACDGINRCFKRCHTLLFVDRQ